jgi:flagellar assembly protein FliH
MGGLLKREDLPAGAIRPFVEAEAPVNPETRVTPAPTPAAGVERHVRLLERIAEEMVRERGRLLADIRPEVLGLVMAVAREVIGREVAVDAAIIESTLAQALQNLHFATRIVVRVHPDDAAHLQEQLAAWQRQTAQVEFVADPGIERGGCRLDSDRGGFDATLQTQLETLHEALIASGVDGAAVSG